MAAMRTGLDKTTLEVRKETKDRVNAVKGQLTADEIINLALDHLPPKRVQELYEAWQRKALEALRRIPGVSGHIRRPPRKP